MSHKSRLEVCDFTGAMTDRATWADLELLSTGFWHRGIVVMMKRGDGRGTVELFLTRGDFEAIKKKADA